MHKPASNIATDDLVDSRNFTFAHTGSYYAATQRPTTDFAKLEGAKTADVCVVGAGFSGISTALHLAERGYNVHVVEANKVGWGASGRNGGEMIDGVGGRALMSKNAEDGSDAMLREMRWAGHDIIRERVKTYNIDCDLKDGYIDLAIKPRHMRALEASKAELDDTNFAHEYELLDRQGIAELLGTDIYMGGLLNMYNGHLHPLNLCTGEAMAAVSLGATIYEQSPVTRIEHTDRPVVHTEHGSITADSVVLCGNAYHDLDKKLRSVVFPLQSFIIVTEPLTEAQVAEINPRDLAVCDPNFLLEYFRLTADKRMLFGTRIPYFGTDSDYIKNELGPRLHRIYPQLKQMRVDFGWTGCVAITVNRVPQFGRLSKNVFYAQGYSGHGVNVTHLAGQIMADAVAGTMERLDLFERIKPVPIPSAAILKKPLTWLGITYYKIRDSL